MRNEYTMDRLRKELLDDFERRFQEELKRARERCSYVNISANIEEGTRGKLTATVTLTCAVGERVTESRALYEYQERSPSVQTARWYCTRDWRD